VEALVEARRARGSFSSAADVVSRAGAGRPSLERLAWSGACDGIAGGRRAALWQLGVAAWRPEPGRRVRGGVQLALPLQAPAAPELPALNAWDAMIADYASTGIALEHHPLGLLREHLPASTVSSRDLEALPHGQRVRVGGLVVARQRPGTAHGIVFMLLEDEHGTINLIVPPAVYERHRLRVRTEPLLLADGRLERHAAAGGAINVLVDRLEALAAPALPMAEVKDFSPLDERERRRAADEAAAAADQESEAGAADFRAVAPAVMSFAAGRRR
jgi:error-prone DNA polymerase